MTTQTPNLNIPKLPTATWYAIGLVVSLSLAIGAKDMMTLAVYAVIVGSPFYLYFKVNQKYAIYLGGGEIVLWAFGVLDTIVDMAASIGEKLQTVGTITFVVLIGVLIYKGGKKIDLW